MSILVVGSIAHDNILKYGGNLKKSLEKETLHGNVNMSIGADHFVKESGGTGLNISYNLALLNKKSILLGAIGEDFYFSDFIQEKVNLEYIYKSELLVSSRSYITVDNFGNQISVFHPGAMEKADYMKVNSIAEEFYYGIIAPTKKEAMLYYLDELQGHGIKIFFDPGQQLSNMTKKDLEKAMKQSNYLIVNKHEFSLFKDITGFSSEEIITAFDKVVITFSEEGSKILDSNSVIEVPAQQLDEIEDPTGAGDAYRAGLISGLSAGYGWKTSAQIGTLLASFCLGAHGAQNHLIDKKQFEMWYAGEYDEEITL